MTMLDNQLQLTSGKLITFNDEQFEGIKKINHWLKNGNTFFTLAGYAGTGKSTMIKKILDDYRWGVVVSAPTHKAKKVVMNTTGEDGQTLHALLGLRPDLDLDNFNPNDPKFNPIALAKITDYNFVIIDEASMINQELYDLILDKTKNSRTKVLFMGDPAQIPPVGEKESVVFKQQNDINEFHQLTKMERQNDTNPLAFVYDALRNNLNTIDGGFPRRSNMNEHGEGVIFTVDKKKFRDAVIDRFKSSEFKKDTDFVKLIAWKNDTVMESNKIIRTALLGDKTNIVEIGDVLMAYRSVSDSKQRYNIIENSADYRVMERSDMEMNKYDIKGYQVKLREDLPHRHYKFQDVFIVDFNDHENLHLYADMHDFFRDMGKSNKKMWTKYYEFRRNNLIMKTVDKYKNGMIRGNSDIIVKDLDYGYAITGHKSQGSTYSHVFVLENDINANWVLKERNQIKYVALTRPSLTATVLTTKLD
jgi:ATP-dependent exoDNAse (exonuclease V) alpha subunit